ncbi:hypothetical protein QBC41DRAFT_357938 [Cercophora samala]|uniref:Uncharacterized protein n=1 Tax=Cercophora samala TaxID=330535 RepID=A0AA40DAG0_9PEZI|nr:hypothetical protein QBC41DRAFT_357938 [Cercophora samala]
MELDKLDLEKGMSIQEVPSNDNSPISNSDTLNNSDYPFPDTVGGDGGGCREWLFFPACEAQFSFILDHWAAKSKETFQEVKELERENQAQGRDDYKKCVTDNDFGRKKQELVDRLTMECKELGTIFTLANTIMHQHSPSQTLTEQYHLWCWDKGLDPEYSGCGLPAEGYRSLGPRPSAIDDFVVSAAETLSKAASSVKTQTSFTMNYFTLRMLSHLFIVLMGAIYFVLPLIIMYMVPMDKTGSVVVTISFTILFCVGSFYFGGGSGGLQTDHKFLLLFAYTSVMATLLSNLTQNHDRGVSVVD